LPQYAGNVATASIVYVCFQVYSLVLWYPVDEPETKYLDLQEFGLRFLMTKIVCEIVLVMRPGAITHTHAIKEVFNWIAGQTRSDNGAVASLAVLVALEAGARVGV
jgi:hypothetical protein